ncbi:hypothetical protein G6F24_015879 [Rhizopus arrhizus]|nr:hypothetical protein G6F24_015879 [Rhizopus arrhizus]
MIGVVVENPAAPSFDPQQFRPLEQVLDDLPPVDEDWLRLARVSGQTVGGRAGGAAGQPQAQDGARAGQGRPAARTERGPSGRRGRHWRLGRLQARAAAWRDGQRQDRGVPAGRRTRAGPGAPGAADGARNQPDAAAGRRAARPP